MVLSESHEVIVALSGVTVARAARPVLQNIELTIAQGDRIFVSGENGAGKSTLLALLAGRLHPYGHGGVRRYAWDGAEGHDFRQSRKHITFISREEQHRLQHIHSRSTVREFLLGHAEGQDFLYRESNAADTERVESLIAQWQVGHLAARRVATLSLGEMRLALLVRAALHSRRLYVLDELFSSLSAAVVERAMQWLKSLPASAAVILTSHDSDRIAGLEFTRRLRVEQGKLAELTDLRPATGAAAVLTPTAAPAMDSTSRPLLIDCRPANFYHDFTCIFRDLQFSLRAGERILLTGPNGSGKSTLLRIMHGDFYPEYGTGPLAFTGALTHETKSELWRRVQLVAASHFTYYPAYMSVQDVLASRYSGSIYDYADSLPPEALEVAAEFTLTALLPRPFASLSEGEKTRVLFARAFLFPAPVYLVDEGFIALSDAHFHRALGYLNRLPAEAALVIAANERISDLTSRLVPVPRLWQLVLPSQAGEPGYPSARLTILP